MPVAGLAAEIGAELLDPEAVYTIACDVYAPCAVGATLDDETIPRLACRIVAGSANNQLARPEHAERLHERGILYAPDYVINAGGALGFGLKALGEKSEETIGERLDALGTKTLAAIFAEGAERNESPLAAARRRVERVLDAARAT